MLLLIISTCTCLNNYLVQAHTTVEPTETQFLEMRAVEIKETEEEGKQLIFELWANDINFQGFDVRFAYDSSKYTPSKLTTNVSTDDETEFYAMDTEFQGRLELFTLPQDAGTIRAIVSFLGKVTDSEHVQNNTLISSGSNVLIGKMSFKMTTDTFDVTDFHLVEDENSSPVTGIKISIDGSDPNDMKSFEAQSTFRFTDRTASKDASLSNLIVSSGVKDDDPEVSTYKEYELTPEFDSETLKYDVTLLEYKDKLDVTAVQNDAKSTMKIKVPKRDENGELEYEDDGTTIKYEEKDIQDNISTEVTINKLGEPDTEITVIVTAEDGKTVNEYSVTIKRPYGVIKGSITPVSLDARQNKSPVGKYNCDIYIYSTDKTSQELDWTTIMEEFSKKQRDNLNSTLHGIEEDIKFTTKAKNDGTESDDDIKAGEYEIYVIPGTYDILQDKAGFLDNIYINLTVNEGDVKDLGNANLIAGDVNKDGIVQIQDKVIVTNNNGVSNTDSDYNEAYDFNADGIVQLRDKVIVNNSNGQKRIITNCA